MDSYAPRLPTALIEAKIDSLPSSAFYISDFISRDEERAILDKVAAAPKPRWKQLTHRRLQTWPSDLVRDALIDAPLPPWLDSPVVERLQSLPVSPADPQHVFQGSPHGRPNHVLINEYPAGVGIMPHKDDGALEPEPEWRILQEPRSLLITTDTLYTNYLHGIADIAHDVDLSADTIANWSLLRDPEALASGQNERQARTSLTYRDVIKVSKLGAKLGFVRRR